MQHSNKHAKVYLDFVFMFSKNKKNQLLRKNFMTTFMASYYI